MSAVTAYYINLDRCPERRSRVESTLDKAGLVPVRCPAIDGSALTPQQREFFDGTRRKRNAEALLTDNEIACFLSHRAVWELVAASKDPFALVLEDDVLLATDACEAVIALHDWMPRCGFVRLCGLRRRRFMTIAPIAKRSIVGLFAGPCGAQAYAITPGAARRLLARSTNFSDQIDIYLDEPWTSGVLPFAVIPYPVQLDQHTSPNSSIGEDRRELERRSRQLQSLMMRLRRRSRRAIKSARRIWWMLRTIYKGWTLKQLTR